MFISMNGYVTMDMGIRGISNTSLALPFFIAISSFFQIHNVSTWYISFAVFQSIVRVSIAILQYFSIWKSIAILQYCTIFEKYCNIAIVQYFWIFYTSLQFSHNLYRKIKTKYYSKKLISFIFSFQILFQVLFIADHYTLALILSINCFCKVDIFQKYCSIAGF